MDIVDATHSASSDVKTGAEKQMHENKEEVQIDKPFHKFRDSYLDLPTDYRNYAGFINGFQLYLIMTLTYIAFENFDKYGLFINISEVLGEFAKGMISIPTILAISGSHLFALLSYLLEVWLSKGLLNENLGLVLIILTLTLEISIPPIAVYYTKSITVSLCILYCNITAFLKLISYHVENYWCRKRMFADKVKMKNTSINQNKNMAGIEVEDSDVIQYPDNLNIKNFYYFLYAPTLCYELNFSRTPNIRKGFLIKTLLEMLFLIPFAFICLQQLFIPLALYYRDCHQEQSSYIRCVTINMKFAISFSFMVLVVQYIVLHTWTNALGEMMRFGDRHFYGEWWNSGNMKNFWKVWNIPFNEWIVRYFYRPLSKRGFSKLQVTSAIFFISGILHEYIFSMTFKTCRIWCILFMLAQIPFVHYASNQEYNQLGNLAVWIILSCFSTTFLSRYLFDFLVLSPLTT